MTKNTKGGRDTQLLHAGYDPASYHGVVNPPIVRASTILYPSLAAYENPDHVYRYGRYATPLSDVFTGVMTELEGGYNAIHAPSGLSAITTALLAFVKAGDHVLMVDSLYPPARMFCDNVLRRMGVEVQYYDPHVGGRISALIKPETRAIYMESPGSATFDVQDVPAIVAVAKTHGLVTLLDNSWASGILYQPLAHGVDVSIVSATKYIGGHSDVMLGAVVAGSEAHFKTIQKTAKDLGVCGGSEEMSLALRGMKTLPVRMREAGARALRIARWLEGQEGVAQVYHPALESHPDHALWKRDFSGCNGLVTIRLPETASKAAVTAFVESLKLFPIGSSWGGYESLLQPQYLEKQRTAVPWTAKGALLRFQVGLENTEDLIADLAQGLEIFRRSL